MKRLIDRNGHTYSKELSFNPSLLLPDKQSFFNLLITTLIRKRFHEKFSFKENPLLKLFTTDNIRENLSLCRIDDYTGPHFFR